MVNLMHFFAHHVLNLCSKTAQLYQQTPINAESPINKGLPR